MTRGNNITAWHFTSVIQSLAIVAAFFVWFWWVAIKALPRQRGHDRWENGPQPW